jgi:hypothetical protein
MPICEKNRVSRFDSNVHDYEWWEYSGLLKSIVSNTTIESAIKIRMLQDFVKTEDDAVDLSILDNVACDGVHIGHSVGEGKQLTLRESCNKIVHATEARLQWVMSQQVADTEFWNGWYNLWGENRSTPWEVTLNIVEWCIAMIRFTKAIQEAIDWGYVFKHDE